MDREAGFLDLGDTRLEYAQITPRVSRGPTLVLLHEGLGSVSTWRDFPELLSGKTGCRALVYSRAGYGRSDPVTLPRPIDFMHRDAVVLARLMEALEIEQPILVGHSDGGSIALIYAGSSPAREAGGLILEAPHVFVEEHGLRSIASMGREYERGALRDRLRRHHGANTEIAFRGWHDVWLHPDFRRWNIESYLKRIAAPILLIQGDADEYGTAAQICAIEAQAAGGVETVWLSGCGHAPHREQTAAVLQAMSAFVSDRVPYRT